MQRQWFGRFLRRLEHLSISRAREEKCPEFDNETIRELFVYSYRIIYAVEEGQVTVAAVIHGKRML
jgi:toxin ParE1/3/4